MVLFDALGRRWTLRVLWELREAPLNFRALQARCEDISPTSLNSRLKMLREMQLVDLNEDGYHLTGQGQELGEQLVVLNGWANRWADSL